MEDKTAQLNKVLDALNEVATCKYLLAEIKIVKLLKTIASCQDVVSVIGETTDDFNFEYEFVKAKSSQIENGASVNIFTLPKDDADVVALVFCMLYAIDDKKLDFTAFLSDYFSIEGENNQTYEKFCEEVLKPFGESLYFLTTGMRVGREPKLIDKIGSDVIFDDKQVDSVHVLIRRLCDEILSQKLAEEERKEVVITSNGFGDAMLTLSTEQILLTYVGFKNTVKGYKNTAKLLAKIEAHLKGRGIL